MDATHLPSTVVPPPLPNKDVDHLKTLTICHYVMAGLSVAGLAFLVLHYTMVRFVFTQVDKIETATAASAKTGETSQPMAQGLFSEQFFGVFLWFYVLFGIIIVAGGILTFLSGRFMSQRKNRTFSMVIAGLSCLVFPNVILGIFTLIVLTRPSVARLYEEVEAQRGTLPA